MKLPFKSEFFISHHIAKRAGDHRDIRFVVDYSGDETWYSFACRKEIPMEQNKRVMIVRTHDHSREEALFVGKIESGYGAGILEVWDQGKCTIEKFSPHHIVIDFKGKKIKGIYHILNLGVVKGKKYKEQQYLFFKGKVQKTEKDK